MPQRLDQLARRLVAFAARAEAAINHFLEVIAAWQPTHIAAAHRTRDVAAQQHRREQADLIHVVALLPAANPAPRDLRRRIEQIERIGRHTTLAALMYGDAEIAELQLLVLADEHVEWCEIAVHCLPLVQDIEGTEDRGELAPNETLRLGAGSRQPDAEVAMHRVLERDTIARFSVLHFRESIEHPERARLSIKKLGEVRLAQPTREALGDLDAHLRRQSVLRRRRREVNFSEPTLSDQPVEVISASA